LGATKWQTVSKVVLPEALPDLFTGYMQVAIRAIGGAAILIYTAGVSVGRLTGDLDLLGPGATLAVHLWYLNSEGIIPDRVAIANGIAALLVILVFLLSGLSWLLGRRIRNGRAGNRRTDR
ncbi:MAG TPA: ABC transporter permease subunit, partial [Clostridia bacterium]|nr:ABC transporter permease subunit [Clostridia bacterium]